MTVEPAPLTAWLAEPLPPDVKTSIDRLRASDDIRHVALMPDAHLSNDVCVGAVVATSQLRYPAAVGGDIGCGILTIAFNAEASVLDSERNAARILAGLYELAPGNKHSKPETLPSALRTQDLTHDRLQRIARREGRVQLGTLGRGNHFLEFQADTSSQLWLMIHTGSRTMGQAITDHHLALTQRGRAGLHFLDAEAPTGQQYLEDVAWARAYASANRLAMLDAVAALLERLFCITADASTLIHCDHNRVDREQHGGNDLWVHRKGAQSAYAGEPGIIPGSMGSASFHTMGRGHSPSLMSCSHGAGRRLSRTEAQRQISNREFARQVGNLWYDHRIASKLRDEAPAAYKDIRRVMKAQRELTQITRELRPLLSYKG